LFVEKTTTIAEDAGGNEFPKDSSRGASIDEPLRAINNQTDYGNKLLMQYSVGGRDITQ
jgi:hypothetical protein